MSAMPPHGSPLSDTDLVLLTTLAEKISTLTQVTEVLETVGARLGATLGLSSCVFVEVDDAAGLAEVTHEWRRDTVPSVLGTYRREEYFTEAFQRVCQAGDHFVVSDTAADPHTDSARFAALRIGALLSVPLLRAGIWRFSLNVHHSDPHLWNPREIELVREVSLRTLAHVERVRAEEASSRLSAIVEFSDDAIISKDLNGVITSWNRGAERVFGYTAREAIGRSVTLLIPEDRLDEEVAVLSRIRRGESIEHYETVRRVKDGRLIDIALTVSPIYNLRGEVAGASKIARDITARKRDEQALRDSEARFRSAVGMISSIVWTNNAVGKMEGDQPSWGQFTGQTPEEYQGYGWAGAVHPEDGQGTIDAWEIAVANRHKFEFEHRVRRHDGEWRWCSVRAVPILDEDGRIREWVGVHHDLTESRRATENSRLLTSISDALLRPSDTGHLIRTVGEKLITHLEVEHFTFADVDDSAEQITVVYDHTCSREPSLPGEYRWSDHVSEEFRQAIIAGHYQVIRDSESDPRSKSQIHRQIGIAASITIPIFQNGRLRHLFFLGHSEPRDWREDEIELAQEVTGRLWSRMESSRAEEFLARAMIESEQQRRLYSTVLSNTPDFIYVFDLEHRFTYANEALLKMWGVSAEEALGKCFLELGYEPWHAAMHESEIDQVIETRQSIRGEVPFSGTGGRRIYDYIFVPVLNALGEVEAVAGSTRDVTERKQAEADQAAERRVFERAATGASLREILDTLLLETEAQSEDGMICSILLLDKTGRYLVQGSAPSLPDSYNEAIDHLKIGPNIGSCGTSAIQGRPVFVEDISTDPQWADFKDLAAAHRLAACCSLPIFSLEGNILGTVAMYYPERNRPSEHDLKLIERTKRLAAIIIERKQAEDSLAERSAKLESADRSKDEFLAMLAHELRNPLAPIRNATEILRDPATSHEERNRAEQLIARQTENMRRMIDDLLDVSRINEGKIELSRRSVNLQEVLTAVAQITLHTCNDQSQTLTVSMPDEAILLHADPTRLEQIFGNLLGNACKYSGPGSHIRLTAEIHGGNEVWIAILDDGVGIEPELLPRIFDLFVQSSRTLDRSRGGLGIGLTIVNRLVAMHGGTIEVRSAGLGHGSEFVVKLPLLAVPPDDPLPVVASPSSERSLRLLIVDDNRDAAESMSILQQIRGHETRTVYTGPDAVSAASEFLPQVVLLDIGLPGMDGYEVARRLRAIPGMENTFLVAVTGYGTQNDQSMAREAGFDEHLSKPADLALLREWLKTRVLS